MFCQYCFEVLELFSNLIQGFVLGSEQWSGVYCVVNICIPTCKKIHGASGVVRRVLPRKLDDLIWFLSLLISSRDLEHCFNQGCLCCKWLQDREKSLLAHVVETEFSTRLSRASCPLGQLHQCPISLCFCRSRLHFQRSPLHTVSKTVTRLTDFAIWGS